MPSGKKGSGKSSASSATRKKQAAKAAKKAGDDASVPPAPPAQRGQKKDKKAKKQPKKKVYVPPPKPPQPPPDPLDTLGLASLLPPGLTVLLRKAAKRDVTTRSRALEGLVNWIDGNDDEGESKNMSDGERQAALVTMLPSWIHLFPRLSASPTRRLRLLTAQILARLLSPAFETRAELLQSPQYSEPLLGPWATLAWDTDRATSNSAQRAWTESVSWNTDESPDKLYLGDYLSPLANYLSLLLVQGSSSGGGIAPVLARATSFAADSTRDAKNRDEANVEEDSHAVDARLAAGALGALGWIFSTYSDVQECEELVNLLHAAPLWTAFGSSRDTPSPAFGVDYPITRLRAWELLGVLTQKHAPLLEQTLHVIAPTALASAWDESDSTVQMKMLESLLPVLSKHKEAWALSTDAQDEESDDSDSDGDDREGEDEEERHSQTNNSTAVPPIAEWNRNLAGFQRWIQSGCAGNAEAFATVIIFLTTIPDNLFPQTSTAWSTFLHNFWTTLSSGLYDADQVARSLFLLSFTEATSYVGGRISKWSREDAGILVAEHLRVLFHQEIAGPQQATSDARRLNATATTRNAKVRDEMDERLVKTISSLATLDAAAPLLDSIMARMSEIATGDVVCAPSDISRAVTILQGIDLSALPDFHQRIAATARQTVASLEHNREGTSVDSRTMLLSQLVSLAWADEQTRSAVVNFSEKVLPPLVTGDQISPSITGTFVKAFVHAAPSTDATQLIVRLIDAASTIKDTKQKVLTLGHVLDGAGPSLSFDAETSGTRLDNVVLDIAAQTISESESEPEGALLLARLIDQPGSFIENETVNQVLALCVTHLHHLAESQSSSSQPLNQPSTIRTQTLLAGWIERQPDRILTIRRMNLLEGLLEATIILRFFRQPTDYQDERLWQTLRDAPDANAAVLKLLKESISDSKAQISTVLNAIRRYIDSGDAPNDFNSIDVLPSSEEIEGLLLQAAKSATVPGSLSTLDPLARPNGAHRLETPTYDADGFTTAARLLVALVAFLEVDRTAARTHAWGLPQLVLLGLLCEDELQAPGSASAFFESNRFASRSGTTQLHSMLHRAVNVSSSILASTASSLSDSWHETATQSFLKGVQVAGTSDVLLTILSTLLRQQGSPYTSRVLSRVLAGILSFSSAGEQDAVKWLRLATARETKDPEVSEAIMVAAKPLAYQNPFYDRQRNDIVSRLASTPPSRANEEGLRLLRSALAIAPLLESDIALVPQQRAVFLLQGLQRWMASDEDFVDEINTRLAELFLHIVPIVQDLPGSHMDFFYDLIESNLEVSALSDEASLPGLYQTLRLLSLLMELGTSNSLLREVYKEHEAALLDLLKPLFTSLVSQDQQAQQNRSRSSLSHQSRIPLAFELTADLIVGVVNKTGSGSFRGTQHSDTLCSLLKSPMREVQVAAYRMLSSSIRSSVQELIFESALDKGDDTEEAKDQVRASIHLPPRLVDAIRSPVGRSTDDLEEDEELRQATLSYLLAWLAIFEHFEDATVQLKSMYGAELQREGLLGSSLLPAVFQLVDPQRTRRSAAPSTGNVAFGGPFDPDRYAIDEIFLDFVDPSDVSSLCQLATHVYFRALLYLPALVREWWIDIRDRQLSLGVASFTTRHCSPLIANRELSHLREPEALSKLQGEAMSIRVLGNNEVVATYTVDEHPMEIGVRVPHDYPLHGVEVRDIRRVGVSEAQWRAWLLAVQQLIVGQNGLVVDALMLFKRNAEAKFAGFEGQECAICYSIISPEDRSLPTKPCKTCKNKFHATCLYKWLHTSGSATCPLCRSIL